MIHEYALEPKLVASWHDRMNFRFFVKQFGFGEARVISLYPKSPKRWNKQVWEAFEADFGETASPTDRTRMKTLLKKIMNPVVKRQDCVWDAACDWLANAESEHTRKPFYAILARNNPRNNTSVMRVDDVLEDTAEGWDTPNGMIVLRTAEEMAKSVAPMLRCATKIRFIDPYFDAHKPRFTNPLAAFVTVAGARAAQNVFERITFELHVSQAHYGREYFVRGCKSALPRVLPLGAKLTIYRWKDKKGGASVTTNTHPRYILTDIGGVSFEKGLDEESEPSITDNLDVVRLPAEVYRLRWNDYDEQNGVFDLDGEAFPVEGRATG